MPNTPLRRTRHLLTDEEISALIASSASINTHERAKWRWAWRARASRLWQKATQMLRQKLP